MIYSTPLAYDVIGFDMFMMPLLVVEVKVKVFFVQERECYEGYEYDDTTHKNCEQYLGQCGSVVADTNEGNATYDCEHFEYELH